jgi:hypothetical protein
MSLSARARVRRAKLTEAQLYKSFAVLLPRANGFGPINYAELLNELGYFGIHNVAGFRRLLQHHRRRLIEIDREPLDVVHQRMYRRELGNEVFRDKMRRNYWFSWEGLARTALELEFGERYLEYARVHHAQED